MAQDPNPSALNMDLHFPVCNPYRSLIGALKGTLRGSLIGTLKGTLKGSL